MQNKKDGNLHLGFVTSFAIVCNIFQRKTIVNQVLGPNYCKLPVAVSQEKPVKLVIQLFYRKFVLACNFNNLDEPFYLS